MRKIKYLILIVILAVIAFIAFTYTSSSYTYPDYKQIDVLSLDNNNNKDVIFDEVYKYLDDNDLEMYTINGKMYKGQVINQFYSSFTNEQFYEKFYLLDSQSIPTNNDFIASYDTQSEDQIGYTKKYLGQNQEVEIRDLTGLKQIPLDRIYYFPNAEVEDIEAITAILNKYDVASKYEAEDNFINMNIYTFYIVIYLLLIMVVLFIVEILLASKEIALKMFHGYALNNIIKEALISYLKPALIINLLLFLIFIITIFFLTRDFVYILKFLQTFLTIAIFINLIILTILAVCVSIAILFIDVTKLKDNIDARFIIFFSYFAKTILLFLICLVLITLNKNIANSYNLKQQLGSWSKVEDYYSTGYYNDTSSIEDHMDFDNMQLMEVDEKSKQFIDLTEEQYNGVIIDAGNYGEMYYSNKEVCDGVYALECNTVVLNQNYLDLMQIKNEYGQPINIADNNQIDIIIPYKLKENEQSIKNQIYNNLNTISPVLNYSLDDFNTIIAEEGMCYQTFDTTTIEPCIDSVALEMGDYYYNYSFLLATGRYFIKLPNSVDPYSDIEPLLIANNLDYNFYKYDNKTSTIYEEYNYVNKQVYKNITMLLFSFIVSIIVSYYTIMIYTTMNRKKLSINMVHGKSIIGMNKPLLVTNMIVTILIFIYFINKISIIELLLILLADNLIMFWTIKSISKKSIISYIKGNNN